MTIASRVFGAIARLPAASAGNVRVERDLRTTMPDGVELMAERFSPEGSDGLPIVLIRTPYGRGGFVRLVALAYAERGYQVVLQSCRGTGGSGGTFDALRNERADGQATLAWLAGQPWFGGSVVMTGPSYLGFTQWAVAPDAPPYLRAIAPQVSASGFRSAIYPGEAFAFGPNLRFAVTMAHNGSRSRLRDVLARLPGRDPVKRAERTLPLGEAATIATGAPVPFFQDWLEHSEPGDPFWDPVEFGRQVGDVQAAVSLVGGWYDVFLPRQLADFVALREAGRTVRLTVGPWVHASPAGFLAGVRDALSWFDTHARGLATDRRTARVRIFVMGADAWRDLPDWPPPSTAMRWHLHARGVLAPETPVATAPDRYRYDPAHPTPSVGGNTLGAGAGARDDRRLEARSDVLLYTSAPLRSDLEVIGPVSAEIHVRSSRPDTDLFVRLCDVAPGGRSVNVTDGPLRVARTLQPPAPDGVTRATVPLWPTAYRFRRGHRVRLVVASGALPRISRNLGGGEPLASATTMHVAHQEVFHDPDHPSAIVLPVTAGA